MGSYVKERNALDSIDHEILNLLARRSKVVGKIGTKKEKDGRPIKDCEREQTQLTALTAEAEKLGLSPYHVTRIYREILGYSVKQQETGVRLPSKKAKTRVAYLGIEGSNTHSAASRHYGAAASPIHLSGYVSFREVFEAVINGETDYGVVPIENTIAGSINEVYDLLSRYNLSIVGEEILSIEHCMLAVEEVALSDIRVVYSHPQALTQCADFFSGLTRCRIEARSDTATAAKLVSEKGDKTCVAIASEDAAAEYNLKVIRRHMSNQRRNYTRFIAIAREPAPYNGGLDYKTSMVFSLLHKTGSLEKCLRLLSEHNINMTKLESRPRPHMPWEYLFYLDVEGSVSGNGLKNALDAMWKHTSYLKVLGSYPVTRSGKGERVVPRIETGGDKTSDTTCPVIEKKPSKRVSREHREENTIVRVGGAVDIGRGFTIIAGPCAVESREQIHETASYIRQAGAHILRGGAYKPRSSPYSFQGLKEEGLTYLREAGEEAGLPTVTEVMEPSQVHLVAGGADMLQVGARNMQNFPLLSAVGEIDKPVLLKRGMMASIDELLLAAEYIVARGNRQVVLCERGIRTFETSTRNTLDLSAVVVLKERTHLPVIVDPSHALGVARWITPLAKAAMACGADGVMIEVHNAPEKALCDGKQSLTYVQFGELMQELTALAKGLGLEPAGREGKPV
ncbi:MAG: 3-deoxy-7-phosphoheptulonate synthase [Planctomycetota bacterium]|nr:MAG: 3-deoxy-7-phosphoheptulonate synthase [Planctomycetota bacterium]